MTPKPDQHIDYDALLSRAVGSLDRNAYATRGAVYEREYRALLKRLSSTVPPSTGTDITREERAFRDAIRRIEFPEYDEPAAPISANAVNAVTGCGAHSGGSMISNASASNTAAAAPPITRPGPAKGK